MSDVLGVSFINYVYRVDIAAVVNECLLHTGSETVHSFSRRVHVGVLSLAWQNTSTSMLHDFIKP